MQKTTRRFISSIAYQVSISAMMLALVSTGAAAAPATKAKTAPAPVMSSYNTDAPAVSGLNGSLDIRGGAAHGDMVGLLGGKVSAPVTHDFGVQFDGALGTTGGNAVKGVAAHAFYRDPKSMLVGAVYQRGWYANQSFNRFGVEGECYKGNLTYVARAGFQNGTLRHGEYTNLDLNWYMNDNLVVTPGFRNVSGHVWGRLASEWQPKALASAPGLALFGSTGAGNHGYAFGMVGIRYYFGTDKTLIRRHREDDPAATSPDDLMDNITQFAPNTIAPTSGGDGGGGGDGIG